MIFTFPYVQVCIYIILLILGKQFCKSWFERTSTQKYIPVAVLEDEFSILSRSLSSSFMTNKTWLPYLVKCLGERREGLQHHSVRLVSFTHSVKFFMFIEHTPEALSPEILGRCFPLRGSQCFYFLLSSVNFSSVIIQEEHWKSISQFRQLHFYFFLLKRILLSVNSSSSEIHCVTFRILSLRNQVCQIQNGSCSVSGTSDQYFANFDYLSSSVGLHLWIKPLLICMWFCLFILITCICNDFTCTTPRKKVFFLSDSSDKSQHCMYIHIYVQTVRVFFVQSYMLDGYWRTLTLVWYLYQLAVPIILPFMCMRSKKNPDEPSFCEMERQLHKLVTFLFCASHNFVRRELWASEQGSKGKALPSRMQ